MVPSRLPPRIPRLGRAAAHAGALILAACGREARPDAALAGAAGRAAETVRQRYQAGDAVAAGAWTWEPVPGVVYVLVDVQSTVPGLVQARADLWLVSDSGAQSLGRSDVMPSAAEFGAYRFEDLSGDGLPDLFGYLADSAGVSYPVFLPGARGSIREELALAAAGWRFATDEDPETAPEVVSGPAGACALRLWAQDPVPDGTPEGWRYLVIHPDGRLGVPSAAAPTCP